MLQLMCGNFLITEVLGESGAVLAGELQSADTPALAERSVAHLCRVGWKSLLHG